MQTKSKINIVFTSTVEAEKQRFKDIISIKKLNYVMHWPKTLKETDELLTNRDIDLIITDLGFENGSLADWLVLWPHPFIILSYYGEEDRVDSLIGDESCSYVMRDPDHRHLGALPTMIRKVLNVRESLSRQNVHLQISERRYLELVRSLPDIVYTLDASGRFLFINEAVSQFGYRPEELVGKHFSSIIYEADVEKVSRSIVLPPLAGQNPEKAPKLFDERRTGPRMTRNLEVRIKLPRNQEQNKDAMVYAFGEVSCTGCSLPEYDGLGIGTVGIIRDISGRKQNEKKREESLRAKA